MGEFDQLVEFDTQLEYIVVDLKQAVDYYQESLQQKVCNSSLCATIDKFETGSIRQITSQLQTGLGSLSGIISNLQSRMNEYVSNFLRVLKETRNF